MPVSGVSKVDLDFFEREGYLVVDDVLDQEREIQPLVAEYMVLLDELADAWFADGTIASTYADLPFPQRWGRVLADTGPAGFNPFDISLPTKGMSPASQMHSGPAVFNVLMSPRLLDVVEQFVGPEIALNPIQRARIKPPEHMLPESFRIVSGATRSTWHQDQGVALPEVDGTNMLTVWIAVTDATEENGCLCVIPGSRHRGLVTHCPGPNGYGMEIPEKLRGGPGVSLPVRSGGVIFLHRQTIHGSRTNTSDAVRWSFDVRYQPVGQPTGRPFFPSFVVRSSKNPTETIADWRAMEALWGETRDRLVAEGFSPPANRWDGSEAVCA
jgi:phytanoyl-CoA hydroxylase